MFSKCLNGGCKRDIKKQIKIKTLLIFAVFALCLSSAQGLDYFAENGDSPLNFRQHPSIATSGNKTYVAYMGPSEDAYVCSYDHVTGVWNGPVLAGTSLLYTGDHHGRPTIAVDDAGYIHIVFGGHGGHDGLPGDNSFYSFISEPDPTIGGRQTQSRSDFPHDISSWSESPSTSGYISGYGTYNQLIKMDDGDMYLFYRHGRHASDWTYQRSTDNGLTWESEVIIMDCIENVTQESWYMWFEKGPNDTIICAYCFHPHPHQGGVERYNVYYMKLNCGDDSWENVTGTTLNMPLVKADADAYTLAYDTSGDFVHEVLARLDPNGYPWIVFPLGDDYVYKSMRWTGSAWTAYTEIDGSRNQQVGDLMVLSATSAKVVLSGYDTSTKDWSVSWYETTDSGASWQWTSDLFRDTDKHRLSSLYLDGHPDAQLLIGEQQAPGKMYLYGESGYVQRGGPLFNPTDDTYSQQNSATTNYGSEEKMESRIGPTHEKNCYIKFDVSGISAPIASATFRAHIKSNPISDLTIHTVADTSWDEMTLIWNNAPAIGGSLDTVVSLAVDEWFELDVTSAITGDGLYSFALKTTHDENSRNISTKESDNAPELVLVYDGGGGGSPPTFNTDPINETDATEDAAYSSTLADDASDPESDPMTFSKASGPAWLTVAANGDLGGTPTNADVGLNVFTVQVTATGGSDQATLNITVLNTNDAPSFTSDPVTEIDATEDAAYSSTIGDDATDPDVGDTLFFSKVTGPAWLSVAGDGTLSGTPTNADVGLNSFTVQVDDDSAAYDQATLEITVNGAGGGGLNFSDGFESGDFSTGGWTTSGSTSVKGASSYSGSYGAELKKAASIEKAISTVGVTNIQVGYARKTAGYDGGETLDVEWSTNGSTWNLLESTADTSWAVQSWSLPAGAEGQAGFRVRFLTNASANNEKAHIDDVTITGTGGGGGNNPPAFTSDPIVETNATEDAAYSSSIADDASDPDSDPMTFSKISGPAWLVIASGGALSGTPGAGDVGLNSFTVEVDDGQGGTDQATLEITVDAAGGSPPGQASSPNPNDGKTKVKVDANLSWSAGSGATSHDVYFGTTSGSLTFQGNQTGTSFNPPGNMPGGTWHYWRIDEVNASGTTTGIEWTFKTK
jgi:hypothetical protein